MTTGKTIALTRRTLVGKVMSLLLNMLSRLVITFLPRSKRFFNFMAAITICIDFGAQKNKVWHCFHCFPIYFPWSDGTGCHDLHFLNVEFRPTFSLSTFTFIKKGDIIFEGTDLCALNLFKGPRHVLLLLFDWFIMILNLDFSPCIPPLASLPTLFCHQFLEPLPATNLSLQLTHWETTN